MGARWGVNSTGRPEALLHLGGVPVVEQAVGGEVLVDRGEVEVLRAARPAPDTPLAASTTIGGGRRSPRRTRPVP